MEITLTDVVHTRSLTESLETLYQT